jgi:protocatechuate 3,4-dioxygenase beta subunit
VQGPDGEPVADAWVVVTAAGEDGLERRTPPTITDADGRFLFEGLADGTYDVHVRGPDADARGSVEGVALGATVTVPLEALGVVHGVVTRDGAPVTRFELDAGGFGGRHTVISADGTFTLERIEPGSRRISVSTDEGAASTSVEIEPGGAPRVELEIGAWGSLEGVLVSATDGQPLAGITLIVRSDSGQRDANERQLGSLFGGGGLETDAQGRFSVDGIGPGKGHIAFQIGKPMMSSSEELGSHAYVLEAGQQLDLGKVVALAPAEVPKDERGSLGMEARPQHASASKDEPEGAPRPIEITWLEPGGPAESAGVQVGDRVLAFDGIAEAELGTETLRDAMRPVRIRSGSSHALKLERDGKPLEVSLVAAKAAAAK